MIDLNETGRSTFSAPNPHRHRCRACGGPWEHDDPGCLLEHGAEDEDCLAGAEDPSLQETPWAI